MAGRVLRFLHHGKNPVILPDGEHTAFFQFLLRGLRVAHHAGRLLLFYIGKKTSQAEVQQVIPCQHQQVIVQPETFHGKLDILYRAQPRLIGLGTVIHHRDVPAPLLLPVRRPV